MSHRLHDLAGYLSWGRKMLFYNSLSKENSMVSPSRLSSGFLLDVALHILAEFPRYLGINLGCALAGLRATLRRDIFDGYVGLKHHNIQTFRVYISIMSGFTTWYQVLTLYPGFNFSHSIYHMPMYFIYISFPAIIEYGTETLASPGIPGIEFENRYLEYSWSQKNYT